MNDVEKIKKINEMAADLKKKGFAETSDDAVKAAEGMFKEKMVEAGESEQKDEDVIPVQNLNRNFEVFKNFANNSINDIKANMKKLAEQLETVIKQINRMEVRIDQKPSQPSQPEPAEARPVEDKQAEGKPSEEKSEEKGPEEKSSEDKPAEENEKKESGSSEPKNQRTGDMKPGDVNLSEMFYYGNK